MMSFMDHWDLDGDDSIADVDNASTQYDHVLMVYSLPGAQIKKIVLVQVRGEHRGDLVQFHGMVLLESICHLWL